MPRDRERGSLLDIVRQASRLTDSILCGTSSGKDSLVNLDLCVKHFKRVEAYFYYLIPGLKFQERYLGYCERRWKIKIHRLPHPGFAYNMAASRLRLHTNIGRSCELLTFVELENEARRLSGIGWIATGDRALESLQRRGMLSACEGLDTKRRRVFPLAWWNHAAVFNYLKRERIPLPSDYRARGGSFNGLTPSNMDWIKREHPQDWKTICDYFPFAEAQLFRESERQRILALEVPELQGGADPQKQIA
jgi:phosphoadenosine phosphosulfate reductase